MAFANDQDDYLPKLDQEEEQVYESLMTRHDAGDIELFTLRRAKLDSIFQHLNRFGDRVAVFHYAGHADGTALQLEDGAGQAAGLAMKLSQLNNLQVVFLNGCSTRAQVAGLKEAGVGAVIATSAKINDDWALYFSIQFYAALATRSTIEQSFVSAVSFLKAKYPVPPQGLGVFRASFKRVPDEPEDALPWGLYGSTSADLNWQIPQAIKDNGPLADLPAAVVPPLYQALTTLNFSKQVPMLRSYLRKKPVSAFLIHGQPQSGHTWLGYNLLTSMREVKALDMSPGIQFGVQVNSVLEYVKELKKWLRAGLSVTTLAAEIPLLAEKLVQKMQTKAVVLRVSEAAYFLQEKTLDEFVQQFWMPLVKAVSEKLAQLNDPGMQRLVLLMFEEKQAVQLQHALLAEKYTDDLQPGIPLILPALEGVGAPELLTWLTQDFARPDSVLIDKFEEMDTEEDCRAFLDGQESLPSIPVLEKICASFDYYFETDEQGRWILTEA